MESLNIVIRRADIKDFPVIMEMIRDLAAFEKAFEEVTNSVEQMILEEEHFFVELAVLDEEIVGMALCFFAYYTWVGKSLYLDDLFVMPAYRGKGIGTLLLRRVFEVALQEDCKRLRWQVLDWNENAVRLYRNIGAAISNQWLNCDFHQQEMKQFLAEEFVVK